MFRRFRDIWHPENYHGTKNKKKFFEGWYFKLVSADLKKKFAFIPGISLSPEDPHCFIQVLEGGSSQTNYVRYSIDEFQIGKKFDLTLGKSRFNIDGLELDILDEFITIKGVINFKDQYKWPGTFFSPGAMGPYQFAPFMQCNHGILSMDHVITGKLAVNGESVDLTGGRGYLEKDWGRSFPRAWIWSQCNDWESPAPTPDPTPTSVSISVATVPWMWSYFTGFIIVVMAGGKFYNFSTYAGGRIKRLRVRDSLVELKIVSKDIVLEAILIKSRGGELASPVKGMMEGRITESLDSRCRIALYRLSRNGSGERQIMFRGKGDPAALEVVGDMDELRSGLGLK